MAAAGTDFDEAGRRGTPVFPATLVKRLQVCRLVGSAPPLPLSSACLPLMLQSPTPLSSIRPRNAFCKRRPWRMFTSRGLTPMRC